MSVSSNVRSGQADSVFIRCCYGYFVSGMVILSFGAIMPSLMEEAGMSFTAAGGLLSFMAVGNLLASFVFPVMTAKLGLRSSITFWSFTIPAVLAVFSMLPPLPVMYLLIFMIGLSRGAITILNNQAVNQIIPNPARHLNFLHCSFAVGAFLSPFLTAWLIDSGLGWKMSLVILAALSVTSALSYARMDYSLLAAPQKKQLRSAADAARPSSRAFFRCPDFYCIALILFFYLGIENCINGWFVTYLQSIGVMSDAFAANLVSIIWLVIMAGRLVTAQLSSILRRSTLILIQTCGSAACFFLLRSSSELPAITAALIGLGFFLAGVFPTCIAEGGTFIVGSTIGMSILTAISAFGGIITPQYIGFWADVVGMSAAMGILQVNVILMVFLGILNAVRSGKRDGRQESNI
ncbi:MAG: MFS transporter [Lachnospiraceae bacterium]|nr:MFS transporter [Lachnospiraceae bacterium]